MNMDTLETPIKKMTPSILQYVHLFVMPGLVFLIPEFIDLGPIRAWAFWILEIVALIYSLLMIGLTHYAVTSRRVQSKAVNIKTLVSSTAAVPIENITDIYVRQNPLQALLGIGNLELDTAGGDGIELIMVGIEKPVEVQNLILGLKGGLE